MRQVVNTMHWSFLTMKQQQAPRLHFLQHLQIHTKVGMLQQTQLTLQIMKKVSIWLMLHSLLQKMLSQQPS